MSDPSACPAAKDLERFIRGQLSHEEAAAVERHLAQCGRCLEGLQTLRKGAPLVHETRTFATSEDGPKNNEIVQGAAEHFTKPPQKTAGSNAEGAAPSPSSPSSGERAATAARPAATMAALFQSPGADDESAHPSASADPTTTGHTNAYYNFLAPPGKPGELGRLGPYRVLKVLGAGGMGVVFRAGTPIWSGWWR